MKGNEPNIYFASLCEVRMGLQTVTTPENLRWLNFSARKKFFQFFYSPRGDKMSLPIGYVVWAEVCRENVERLLHTGILPYYPFEWNEGKICLVLDVAFVDGLTSWNRRALKQFLASKACIAFKKGSKTRVYKRKFGQFRKLTMDTNYKFKSGS